MPYTRILWILVLLLSLTAPGYAANTYYISPNTSLASDSNPGTSTSAPWATFAFAIPRLFAGDTLILLDGTYTRTGTGHPYIDCSTTAHHGTSATNQITLRAQNERQAFLQGSGPAVFVIYACNWWTVEGLYLRN